ncbi:MAG: DUF371 domain-containing protein [Candidatus Altiarchaeota archaeon]|nr:DUF371 domain-containing protein [Candidatus Altiarchaeota archaeon]
MLSEVVHARGHPNVVSAHRTTVEFTMERELSLRGDCIVAVSADKGCAGLSDEFKKALRSDGVRLELEIECGGVRDTVMAGGSSKLVLLHPTDAVIRKSDFVCERTLAVNADKAACDLDRKLVEELKSGKPVLLKLNLKS